MHVDLGDKLLFNAYQLGYFLDWLCFDFLFVHDIYLYTRKTELSTKSLYIYIRFLMSADDGRKKAVNWWKVSENSVRLVSSGVLALFSRFFGGFDARFGDCVTFFGGT